MPVTSARLADIPRRAFENSSKGLKDFPGASPEGDYDEGLSKSQLVAGLETEFVLV